MKRIMKKWNGKAAKRYFSMLLAFTIIFQLLSGFTSVAGQAVNDMDTQETVPSSLETDSPEQDITGENEEQGATDEQVTQEPEKQEEEPENQDVQVVYDDQPMSKEEVEALISNYEETKATDSQKALSEKPKWKESIEESWLPEGYELEYVDDDATYPEGYYTFLENKFSEEKKKETPKQIAPMAAGDLWNGSIATGFSAGNGTQASPYQIEDGSELAFLASAINAGTAAQPGNEAYDTAYYKLTADINLNAREWTPIGSNANPFKGNFNGGNFTVKNFKTTGVTATYKGLFGVANDSSMYDLNIDGASISGKNNVGVLVGHAYGSLEVTNVTISNSSAAAGGTGTGAGSNVGGVIGYYYTAWTTKLAVTNVTVTNTTVKCTSTAVTASENAGGIVGLFLAQGATDANVSFENITADIGTLSGNHYVGGVIGHSLIQNDSNGVKVSLKNVKTSGDYKAVGTSTAYNSVTNENAFRIGSSLGGVLGRYGVQGSSNCDLTIEGVSSSATITANKANIGGLIGVYWVHKGASDGATVNNNFSMKDSSASGKVAHSTTGGHINRAGGIVGNVMICSAEGGTTSFENVHATGNVTSGEYDAGGFAGFMAMESKQPEDLAYGVGTKNHTISIVNCTATGDVKANSFNAGGFIGKFKEQNGTNNRLYVEGCKASGDVTGSSFNNGGFIGHVEPRTSTVDGTYTFKNSSASGSVYSAAYNAGGFVGHSDIEDTVAATTISKNLTIEYESCFATGDVYAANYNVGGFVGHAEAQATSCRQYFRNSFATGNARGTAGAFGYGTGGFGGSLNMGTVTENCYSTGAATGVAAQTGSFAGGTGYPHSAVARPNVEDPLIKNCFASGTSSGNGFVGKDNSNHRNKTIYENCFFDTTTTKKTTSGATGTSAGQVVGVSTEDMLEPDTFQSWNILNVNHVSMSKNQQGQSSPWYIDQKATYPYLYFQADGYDTDGDGKGDGYFDYQKKIPTDFDNTNYFLGILYSNVGAQRRVVAPHRYDFTLSDTATSAATFDAMTLGADRLYFPYNPDTTVGGYKNQQYWFEDGVRNSDSDGEDWVSAARGKTTSFAAKQKISVGTYSKTNIVAFASGPYSLKNNDTETWEKNVKSSYTWTGQKVTYRTMFTNYHISADWQEMTFEDPLAKGVTLANDFVFLYTGRVPSTDEKPGENNSLSTELKIPNGTGKESSMGTDPYYVYEPGTGQYAGRYVLTIKNLPDISCAKIDSTHPDVLVLDGYYVEFVAQVTQEAASAQFPVNSVDEAGYAKIDNIRNRGTSSGKLQLWDPDLLFDSNGNTTGNKVPLKDDQGNVMEKIPVAIEVDDKDRDPVYNAPVISYNNNHTKYITGTTDIQEDKDYFISDNSRKHKVIPNEDPNDPATPPHERLDYAGFEPPNENYEFDCWYYLEDFETQGKWARDDVTTADGEEILPPTSYGTVVYISQEDIKNGTYLDPATNPVLQDRDKTILFAKWRLKGIPFSFTKTNKEGTALENVAFELYYWEGASAPTGADNYVVVSGTGANVQAGKWVKHEFNATDNNLTDSNGLIEPLFTKAGEYRLVETVTNTGYYLPENQWKFVCDIANYTLSDPVSVKKNDDVYSIDFSSKTVGTETEWFLVNERSGAVNIQKFDSEGNPLNGAEFALERQKADGTWELIETGVTAGSGADTGKYQFGQNSGVNTLAPGHYRLKETKSPQGHALLLEPIEFNLPLELSGDVVTDPTEQSKAQYSYTGSDSKVYYGYTNPRYVITNTANFEMPESGSLGTYALWILGIGLLALAGFGAYKLKKKA